MNAVFEIIGMVVVVLLAVVSVWWSLGWIMDKCVWGRLPTDNRIYWTGKNSSTQVALHGIGFTLGRSFIGLIYHTRTVIEEDEDNGA